jgi:hypothetical protein
MRSRFKTDGYQNFEKLELNNAVLLAYRRYFHRPDKFEALYESMGRDLRKVIEYFKMIKASGNKVALSSFLE